MPDKYRTPSSGGKWRPTAEFLRDLVDMVQERNAFKSLSQQGIDVSPDHRIRIHNTSDDVIPKFGIVGIGEPITLPETNEEEFKNRKGFDSIDPVENAKFAVLQEPIASGTIGEALLLGVTQCRIDVLDNNHRFAGPITDDYSRLRSSLTGQAEIHWKESGVGEVWAVVVFGVTQIDGYIEKEVVTAINCVDGRITVTTEVLEIVGESQFSGIHATSVLYTPAVPGDWE